MTVSIWLWHLNHWYWYVSIVYTMTYLQMYWPSCLTNSQLTEEGYLIETVQWRFCHEEQMTNRLFGMLWRRHTTREILNERGKYTTRYPELAYTQPELWSKRKLVSKQIQLQSGWRLNHKLRRLNVAPWFQVRKTGKTNVSNCILVLDYGVKFPFASLAFLLFERIHIDFRWKEGCTISGKKRRAV